MSSNYLTADNGVSSGVTGITQSAGSDGTLQIRTTTSGGSATTALTIDNLQNVGVGVTPSAWATLGPVLQMGAYGAFIGAQSGSEIVRIGSNTYYNAGFKYTTSNPASFYSQSGGAHTWYSAPSGTAGNVISFTTAMTLNSSGSLVFGVSGQGIQFSNSSAISSQLLNDYETGTWTPNQGSGLTVTGTFSSSGTYTKVGKLVMVTFRLSGSTSIASSNGGVISTNLPFATETSAATGYYGSMANNTTGTTVGETYISTVYCTTALAATTSIYGTITYQATF